MDRFDGGFNAFFLGGYHLSCGKKGWSICPVLFVSTTYRRGTIASQNSAQTVTS